MINIFKIYIMKKIDNRKRLAWFMLAPVLIMALFSACKKQESNIEVVSNDKTKPGVVTDVKVKNFNGGAYITYKLPSSANLLYVLADYKINDKKSRQTKASYYTDTIMVDGFAQTKEYQVTLYAVSRANIKSDPVVVTVHPDLPEYLLVNTGLALTPDFGGVNVFGLNKTNAPVAIHVISPNAVTGKYDEQEPQYVSADTVNFSVRGYEDKPIKFGVFTTDKYGNYSDTVFSTLTPYHEVLLDKSKFFVYHLASDSEIGYGWELRRFFDGSTDEPNGWHTNPGASPTIQGTFGLGVKAQLSRFTLWERVSGAYGYANAKRFTVWGSDKDTPQDIALPNNSTAGTIVGDWVNMGSYNFPNPPSGLPANQANTQDISFVANGVNFNVNIAAPPAKFIRFVINQTWGGVDYGNTMEISLYGNPL
jgi:hypothetical protein